MTNPLQAVVLAGGEGTRLRPITEALPKPFVRVAGKPTIEYVLERLRDAGVHDVIVTTCYKPLPIIERLAGGSRFGLRIFHSIEDEPLGTAGAVRKCLPLLHGTFVVASGDVLADVDVAKLVAFHRERRAVATMALTEVENPSEFGVVATDKEGRVERFQEKPKREDAFSNLINAGIYVLEPEVVARVPPGVVHDFSKQLFPALLAANARLFATRVEGTWVDVGRPADLLRASDRMAKRRFGGPYLDAEAKVAKGAKVTGSHLYPETEVGEAVVEGSILYERARVADGATVRRSILCEGASVEAGAVVEDSVLGAFSRVPAKARVRDGRLPGGETFGEG